MSEHLVSCHFGSSPKAVSPLLSFFFQYSGGRDCRASMKPLPPSYSSKGSGMSGEAKKGSAAKGSQSWRKKAVPPSEGESSPSRISTAKEVAILGRSSGFHAAGAWAARLEIANLLESRCDPERLVSEIRKGQESSAEIRMDGGLSQEVTEFLRSGRSDTDLEMVSETRGASPASKHSSEGNEDVVAKQKAILESLTSSTSAPAWANQGESSWQFSKPAWAGVARSGDSSFKRKAVAPPDGSLGREEGSVRAPSPPASEKPESASFSRKARPPTEEQVMKKEAQIPKFTTSGGRKADGSMKERELAELKRFQEISCAIFVDMQEMGLRMDIGELVVGDDGSLDLDRFMLHIAPSRAATGLRYARLMRNLIRWTSENPNPFKNKEASVEKLNVLGYLEWMVNRETGSRTPQSLLYALDFYARAFGFGIGGSHLERSKRLSLRYSQLKRTDRKAAPMFSRRFMWILEEVALDDRRPLPQRVACGKLRVCIQCSMRHNDLLNTPLSDYEWVRRRGSMDIIALRSKALKGKSGARAWICSTLAVDKGHDKWLSVLVGLLIESHGVAWTSHDFTGRLPGPGGAGFLEAPSTLEQDVIQVKLCLQTLLREGVDPGMTTFETAILRWHGAKATLTSIMQHLGLDPKIVRFSGDWSQRDESMADTYLREAQMLALRGQERSLLFLRRGGDLGGLVGESILKNKGEQVDGIDADEFLATDEEIAAGLGDFGLNPVAVDEHMLDGCFDKGLPDLEAVKKEAENPPVVSPDEMAVFFGQDSDQDTEYDKSEDEREAKRQLKEGLAVVGEAEALMTSALEDTEGMVFRFVMARRALPTSKLHLPPKEDDPDGEPTMAKPRCGALGSFDFVSLEENFGECELCVRCFGRASHCSKLCNVCVEYGDPPRKRTCSRRCAEMGSAHTSHACVVHQ